MRFVDLHSHILPGIDDGPSSASEAVAMLRLAHEGGTRAMVATPHRFLPPYDNADPVLLASSFRRFTEHLARLRDEDAAGEHAFLGEMALYLGAEHCVSPEFLGALEKRELVSLNGSRYLLIEFPPFLPYEVAVSAVERILQTGLVPVLAHVERYPFLHKGTAKLRALLQVGCIAQVNASSVLGASGRARARLVNKLLARGLVQIIASDGHGAATRPPDLGRVAAALGNRHPADRVALWLWENATRVLEDRPLTS